MNLDATEPLTPPNCDLRDFQFMPLDVRRLLTSETWVLGTGDERAAAMCLWLESWHQVPAGSLPDNDRMLRHLAQCGRWEDAKDQAMRGWILCTDGRLYHPVVAEKALEAWIEKLMNRAMGAAGNAKRWGLKVDGESVRAEMIVAIQLLTQLAPSSKTLKKKSVVTILSESPPDVKTVPTGSPPDTKSDPDASPPDKEHIPTGSPPMVFRSPRDRQAIAIDRDRDRDRDRDK